jgi:hypothetical protein
MPRTALLRLASFSAALPRQEIRTRLGRRQLRRYFRVTLPDQSTRIVMDAPPDKEDCRPFVTGRRAVSRGRRACPRSARQDLEQGFLLLSDLGSTTYLSALQDRSSAPTLPRRQRALVAIQLASRPGVLPDYDRACSAANSRSSPTGTWPPPWPDRSTKANADHCLTRCLPRSSPTTCATATGLRPSRLPLAQPDGRRRRSSFPANPGILDFQDAVYGPADLRSRLALSRRLHRLAGRSGTRLRDPLLGRGAPGRLPVHADFHDFYRDYEWMGAQRQLKVLGIFARLCHRDGKHDYLKPTCRACWAICAGPASATASCGRSPPARPLEKRPLERRLHLLMKAMILAAGRGERLRPLTDTTPNHCCMAGGKALIVWHLQAPGGSRLARGGDQPRPSRRADRSGARRRQRLRPAHRLLARTGRSAGNRRRHRRGTATARRTTVSGGQWRHLVRLGLRARRTLAAQALDQRRAHLLLVDNPPHHPGGDFCLAGEDRAQCCRTSPATALTYAGIGVFWPDFFAAVPAARRR